MKLNKFPGDLSDISGIEKPLHTRNTVPNSAITVSKKDYLLNEQAKYRVRLLMRIVSDYQQVEGILLTSISQEMFRSLIEELKMDDKR